MGAVIRPYFTADQASFYGLRKLRVVGRFSYQLFSTTGALPQSLFDFRFFQEARAFFRAGKMGQ